MKPSRFTTFELSDPRFTHDGLRWATVKSESLKGRGDVTLFVPPEVDGSGVRDVPLAILLHGVYGSHWAWALKGGAHRTAARMIRSGEIPPMVLAMPSDGLCGDGSGYVKHDRQDFEGWIVEDVPAVARQAVPEVTEGSPVLMAGLSMGGFGALRLGGKFPKRFRAVSGHSSATHADQLRRFAAEDFAGWSPAAEDQSIIGAWRKTAGPLPAFRFDCGIDDPLLEGNRALHRDLEAAGIPHRYEEFPGGHTWEYWELHLEDTLRFFAGRLRAEGPVERIHAGENRGQPRTEVNSPESDGSHPATNTL